MCKSILAAAVLLTASLASFAASAREIQLWGGDEEPGTIIVETSQRRLYYVLGAGEAISYKIAVGKPGRKWYGTTQVVGKRKNPDWRPTPRMRRENPRLPEMMPAGPNNPLGSRAIYLADQTLRIHGTNDPSSIGKAASSGCFRMYRDDVEHLYDIVDVGAKVYVRE